MNGNDGRLFTATRKQLMDYEVILINKRGDELWRFCNGDDGKPQWKVWAVEPTDRTTIRHWQCTTVGAHYYQTGRHIPGGKKFIGYDCIIPKKYLMRTAKLLGLNLNHVKKPLSQKELEHLRRASIKGLKVLAELKESRP